MNRCRICGGTAGNSGICSVCETKLKAEQEAKDYANRLAADPLRVREIKSFEPGTNIFHHDLLSCGQDITSMVRKSSENYNERVLVMTHGISNDNKFLIVDELTGRRWLIELPNTKGVDQFNNPQFMEMILNENYL